MEERMATKKKAAKKNVTSKKSVSSKAKKKKTTTSARKAAGLDIPSLFRLNVEVGDLDQAAEFYGELFGLEGRKQAGSRVYFTCGPVTLQVVDVSSAGKPHPAAKALYFTVRDLDAVFERARKLGCLAGDDVHGVAGGSIGVRPWGERSFYAEDFWKNPLCFVEAGTIYPG
jgi:catechol 2,3-dioxygenase-like lactoylglutathione lyase family enzyme